MRDKLENRIGVLAGVRNRIKSLALPSTTSNMYNNNSSSSSSGNSNSSSNNNSNNRDKVRDNNSKNDDNEGKISPYKCSTTYCRSDITLNDVANKMKPLYPKASKNQSKNNDYNNSYNNSNKNNSNYQCTNIGERKELLLCNNSDKINNKTSKNTLKYQSTYDVTVYSASYTCQEAKEGNAVAVTVRIQVKNTSL